MASKTGTFHYPLTVDGYRAIYRGYLADPDLQDARARWPFVAAMWDNHWNSSWQGWQKHPESRRTLERPGPEHQGYAANQAWFEYLPARVAPPEADRSRRSDPHRIVKDVPIEQWDENGLGIEPNNVAAINSLIGYRAFRYGRHLDLIITDQHSYRSADAFDDKAVGAFGPKFTGMFPEDAAQILDGGRAFDGGKPPAEVSFNDAHVANPRNNAPPQTILGATQKAWFKEPAAQDRRCDLEDLGQFRRRAGLAQRSAEPSAWTGKGDLAEEHLCRDDHRRLWNGLSCPGAPRYTDLVRDERMTGFAIISGDRHSFWAGYATSELPPGKFDPVGLSFVGASLSSAGTMESERAWFAESRSASSAVPCRSPPAEANLIGPTTCC